MATRRAFFARVRERASARSGGSMPTVLYNDDGFRKYNWWYRRGRDAYWSARESNEREEITDVRERST